MQNLAEIDKIQGDNTIPAFKTELCYLASSHEKVISCCETA